MPSQVCVDWEVGLGPRLRGWAAWLKGGQSLWCSKAVLGRWVWAPCGLAFW